MSVDSPPAPSADPPDALGRRASPERPPPPLPRPGERWALFLDFDGTLAEIVAHPERVAVEAGLPRLLGRLRDALGGALAVVSGRPLAEIDRFLAPLELPGAGLHGLEVRGSDGRVVRLAEAPPGFGEVRERLAAMVRSDPRLVLEDKGVTLALHYRGAPERAGECRGAAERLLPELPGYVLQEGKMVYELKPARGDKGDAIRRLLADPLFAGRTPVFAGDDVTDEDGFTAVQALGGLGIKVGPGPSVARAGVPDRAALLAWLDRATGVLSAGQGREGGDDGRS